MISLPHKLLTFCLALLLLLVHDTRKYTHTYLIYKYKTPKSYTNRISTNLMRLTQNLYRLRAPEGACGVQSKKGAPQTRHTNEKQL